MENFANKVKESDFEIVLSKKRKEMSLHQKLWFNRFTSVLQYKIWLYGRWNVKIVKLCMNKSVIHRVDTNFYPMMSIQKCWYSKKLTNYAALTEPLLKKD
jgi:hypothetical protein